MSFSEVDANFTALADDTQRLFGRVYTPIANVAAIPGAPADGDRIEVLNSSGIRQALGVQGIPGDFPSSGDVSSLSVRLRYSASESAWVWVDYAAARPDARYAPLSDFQSLANEVSTKAPGASAVVSSPVGFMDFTGIPSWARRVVMLLDGISGDSTSHFLIQAGAGTAPLTGGYRNCTSTLSYNSGGAQGVAIAASTVGVPIFSNNATYVHTGRVAMERFGSASNDWVVTINTNISAGGILTGAVQSAGVAPLSGALGMVRLVPESPMAIDAGRVVVRWE